MDVTQHLGRQGHPRPNVSKKPEVQSFIYALEACLGNLDFLYNNSFVWMHVLGELSSHWTPKAFLSPAHPKMSATLFSEYSHPFLTIIIAISWT